MVIVALGIDHCGQFFCPLPPVAVGKDEHLDEVILMTFEPGKFLRSTKKSKFFADQVLAVIFYVSLAPIFWL